MNFVEIFLYLKKNDLMGRKLIEDIIKTIPSVGEIINTTWNYLNLSKQYVRRNFGEVLMRFDKEATNVFKKYEREAIKELALSWIESRKDEIKRELYEIIEKEDFVERLSQKFVEFAVLVQEFEKILGNMRKARGGKTFEKVLVKLLNYIGIKCETPAGKFKEKLKRVDIVIPSSAVALKTPDKAIFLTCKRTLRERWKQEVPQARLNQRIYLITIDENISESKAREINQKGLIAFIPDKIKMEKFKGMPWIRKLSDLPKEVKI